MPTHMKKKIKSFRVSRKYLTSVNDTRTITLFYPSGQKVEGTAVGTKDHPKFTEFRNKLEKLGYIQTERNWINGDRVLKSFILNGMKLKKGDKFACACALEIQIRVYKNYEKK